MEIKIYDKNKNLRLNNFLLEKGQEDLRLIIFSVFTAIIFDYLFYGFTTIGASYPVFMLTFYSLFYYQLRTKINFKNKFQWFLLLPIFLLSITFLIFSNELLATINFLLIPFLILAHTIISTSNNSHNWYRLSFINDIFYKAVYKIAKNLLKPLSIAFL